MLRLIAAILISCLAGPLSASCEGPAAFDALSEAERAAYEQRASEVPFSEGLMWQVERDGVSSVIVGTLHFPAKGHAQLMTRIDTLPITPQQVLIELTKSDEVAMLRHITANPDLYLINEGPSLIDRLGDDLWTKLKPKLAVKGLPAFMAARYQPWFLGLALSVPPCASADLRAGKHGLDRQIENWAGENALQVRSLDNFHHVLSLLASDPLDEQIDIMKWSLSLDLDQQGADDTAEMLSLYFREKIQLIWERASDKAMAQVDTPEDVQRVKELFLDVQAGLIEERNAFWLETLASELVQTPTLVAVGAMHLPGEKGLLALLQDQGYSVSRLPLREK
ncbi:TraB/GumN family protein [Shimia sp. W99]